jgi:hypothetical protein
VVGQWWLIELLFGLIVTSVVVWTSFATDRLYTEGSYRLRKEKQGPSKNLTSLRNEALLPTEYKTRKTGPRSLALGAALSAALVIYGSCVVTGPLSGGSFSFLLFTPQLFHADGVNFTSQFLLFFFAPLITGILSAVVFAFVLWLTRTAAWNRELQSDEMNFNEAGLGPKGRGVPENAPGLVFSGVDVY